MKFSKSVVLIIVLFLAGAWGFARYQDSLTARDSTLENLVVGISKGNLAPDFEGTVLDGGHISLEDYRGQIVVLNTFASWCGPCLIETPHLVEVANENPDVQFLGLNEKESPDTVDSYQVEFSVPYPLILNENGDLTKIYPLRGLPTTWFIDEDGVIRYIHAGPMTQGMLEKIISDMRAGLDPNPFGFVQK